MSAWLLNAYFVLVFDGDFFFVFGIEHKGEVDVVLELKFAVFSEEFGVS